MNREMRPPEDHVRFARAVSRLFGWVYTLAWSWSFYPQPILNIRRQSTVGSTIDFPAINTLGFVFYFLSNTLLFAEPKVRAQYAARNPTEPEPTVRENDVAFAGHGVVLAGLTLTMFWESLWGFRQRAGQRISRSILGIGIGCIVGVLLMVIVVWVWGGEDPLGWAALDVVYAMGYAKLVVTVVKYIPQVMVNYRRRSTIGWSIWQILCDFLGGVLSVAQLLIDSSLESDWSGVRGNLPKLFLGNISIFFDLIFILQHYYLYPQREAPDERRSLLSDRNEE